MQRMVRPKRLKDLYMVEFWSNSVATNPFDGSESHEVSVAHVASSLRKAKEFCRTHDNYGGNPDWPDYFPWHFRVRHQKLDEDQCHDVHNHSRVLFHYDPQDG